MKIALPLKNDNNLESEISEHFGHASFFGFIEINNNKITNVEVIKNEFENHSPGDLPSLIKKKNADVLLAYGMGERAIQFFNEYDIKVITGVKGTVREVVDKYLKGELDFDNSWKEHEEFHHHHD